MPAGDLVVAEGQIELRATLMGDGTDIRIDRLKGGVRGLRSGEMKYAETDYGHADGSFIGDVYRASKTITIALNIKGATVAVTNANIDLMDTVWNEPSNVDIPLYFRLPGMAKSYVMGRPLGIVIEEDQAVIKHVPALAMFRLGEDLTIHAA